MKVLGGSSSINGMVYVRGNAMDFDTWEEMGAKGWGYSHCLPYFKKCETWNEGGDEYRGGDGPLATTNGMILHIHTTHTYIHMQIHYYTSIYPHSRIRSYTHTRVHTHGVHTGKNVLETPLYDSFVKAGGEAGYPITEDYNGYQQEG